MRRKLIPHGPSSMTVSLPSKWVKYNNLRKGEEIEIIEEENDLVIKSVTNINNIKCAEISFVNVDRATREDLLMTMHKKGYDDIKINLEDINTIKEIHAFLNRMQLGFEIIKQDSDSITIRNISNPQAEQFDNLFRRVFRILIEYSNKIETIIRNKNELTHSRILHEVSIIRISNYCKRIIITEKQKNACFYYNIIEELNNITYILTNLLDEVMKIEENVPKNIVTKYSEVTNILIEVYKLYYDFSIEEYSVIKKDLELTKNSLNKLRSKTVSESVCIDHIESMREGIQNLLSSTLAIQF